MSYLDEGKTYALIEDEFNELVEEIRKRNQSNLTGVKIGGLPVAAQINENDMLLVEQADGTKSTTMRTIMDFAGICPEVIEARPSVTGTQHANLKARLDEMETKGNTSEQRLNTVQPIAESLQEEISNARGLNANGQVHPNLKSRLDELQSWIELLGGGTGTINDIVKELQDAINQNMANIEALRNKNTEQDANIDGIEQRVEALENGVIGDIPDLVNRVTAVEAVADKNKQDIETLKRGTIKFRVV